MTSEPVRGAEIGWGPVPDMFVAEGREERVLVEPPPGARARVAASINSSTEKCARMCVFGRDAGDNCDRWFRNQDFTFKLIEKTDEVSTYCSVCGPHPVPPPNPDLTKPPAAMPPSPQTLQ